MKVNNVRMPVSQGSMPVRMTMRLRSLPSLVYMLMVLVMDMQVLVFYRLV